MQVEIDVDLKAWDELDYFLSAQSPRLGKRNHWFGAFRSGSQGVRIRTWAFRRHYFEAHNWVQRHGLRFEQEYQLATMLFHMDSSIECMVYAANAIGNAVSLVEFYDVDDTSQLRRIRPENVLDLPPRGRAGYEKHFPRFTKLMRAYAPMISIIMLNHDVSKHRHVNHPGSRMRRDIPEGFYEAHGICQDHHGAHWLNPVERTYLVRDPKLSIAESIAAPVEEPIIFERVAELYGRFMSVIGGELLADTRDAVLQVPVSSSVDSSNGQ